MSITNEDSPDKRPDLSTDDGKAVLRKELDSIYNILVTDVAASRSTTVSDVKSNYGRGATMLAGDALKVGMIDGIGTIDQSANKTAISGDTKEGSIMAMDLKTLKENHPGVYAEAVEDGVLKERKRVEAHLIMGEGYQAMDAAVKAIKAGDDLQDQVVLANYLTQKAKTQAINDRDQDEKILDDVKASTQDVTAEDTEAAKLFDQSEGLGDLDD